jgi:hypothetical protein
MHKTLANLRGFTSYYFHCYDDHLNYKYDYGDGVEEVQGNADGNGNGHGYSYGSHLGNGFVLEYDYQNRLSDFKNGNGVCDEICFRFREKNA